MFSCPECDAEIAGRDACCPECGHGAADGPVWKVAFGSVEDLRTHFDQYLVHHGLAVPHGMPQRVRGVVQVYPALPGVGRLFSVEFVGQHALESCHRRAMP